MSSRIIDSSFRSGLIQEFPAQLQRGAESPTGLPRHQCDTVQHERIQPQTAVQFAVTLTWLFLFLPWYSSVAFTAYTASRPGLRHIFAFGPGLWRVACVIAAVRVPALWLGSAGLRRAGWPQIPGYFLLVLDLPEIYLIRAARYTPERWAILGSLILAGTSLAWAAAFVWLWNRLVTADSSVR